MTELRKQRGQLSFQRLLYQLTRPRADQIRQRIG